VGCNAPSYSLDVNGTINASSNVFINGSALLPAASLYSTVRGLGSVGYVSTAQLNSLMSNTSVSTVRGLGDSGYVSSFSLTSTIQGLGTAGYVSSLGNLTNLTNVNCLQGVFSSIGVNCNTPAHRLDVNGTINTTGELTVGDRASSSTRGLLRLLTQDGASFIQSGSNATGGGFAPLHFTPLNGFPENSVMTINMSNGRVGIGCNAPAFSLDVVGKLNVSGNPGFGLIQLRGTTSESTSFYIDPVNAGTSSNTGWITGQTTSIGNVGPAHITTFGVTRVNNGGLSEYGYYMTSNGRFGINCNTPAVALDVVGDLVISGRGQINKGLLINGINGPYVTNIFGNVGINIPNSNPTYPLDVAGQIRCTGFDASVGGINLASGLNNVAYNFFCSANSTGGNVPNSLQLYQYGPNSSTGTELLRVLESDTTRAFRWSGDLLVGGSSSNNLIRFRGTAGDSEGNFNTSVIGERIFSSPESSELLIFKGDGDGVGGSSAADRDRVRVLSSGGFQVDISLYGGGNWNIGGNPPATKLTALNIDGNGTATFGATVTASDFIATSDKTLKENIVDARTNYLDDLNKLRVVNYNRIGKTKKELGFIAQEVEEVFPSIVEKNGYDDKKAYSITALIPMLVSAVQSLSKTVSSLQGQIDEIKSASNPITP